MKKLFFLLVFIGLWTQIVAQEPDKLVIGKDTTNCQIKISKKKGETVVAFKKAYQSEWNEIYALYADAAIVSDKSLYLSLKLPDTPEKVWVKCFFDGAYKLLQYHETYYIAAPEGITKLNESSKGAEGEESPGIKLFIGQMILIFHQKVDYNFRLLEYNSRSLVLPLIKYHEEKNLRYRDYNHYLEVTTDWNLSAGFSFENYTLSSKFIKAVGVKGYSPIVAANLIVCFPKLSSRLFIFSGVEISNPQIDALKIKSIGDRNYYFDISYKGLNLGVPVMAGFKLVDRDLISLSINTGIEVLKGFSLDQSLRIETKENDIVRTELATMGNNSGMMFLHCNELNLGIPFVSKSLSIGTSYNYSLSKSSLINNTVSRDHSTSIYARFTF